jgi:hypothetical protein
MNGCSRRLGVCIVGASIALGCSPQQETLLDKTAIETKNATRSVVVRDRLGDGAARIGIASEKLLPREALERFVGRGGPLPGGAGEESNGGYPFNLPQVFGVGSTGTIYVADHVNEKIARFDSQGRFLGSFPFPPNGKRKPKQQGFAFTAGRISTDLNGFVYVTPYADTRDHNVRFYKYSHDGRLLKIHKLGDKGSFVVSNGDLFEFGDGVLTRLNQHGKVIHTTKGPMDTTGYRYRTFQVDPDSNLYLVEPDVMVAAYDPTGKVIWRKKCGELVSRLTKHYSYREGRIDKVIPMCELPEWIDKNGNAYWIDQGILVTKTDSTGKELGKMDLGQYSLTHRGAFDNEGNLYFLNDTVTEFLVEKVGFQKVQ